MILEELAAKHRHSMPGADLVCEYEAAIPVYELRIKLSLLKQFEIPTIPQFALRLISENCRSESAIADALGLAPKFIRAALVYLDQLQLIQRQYGISEADALVFSITEKGTQALDGLLTAVDTDHAELVVDGFTGQLALAGSSYLDRGPDLKKEGVLLLAPVKGTRPTIEQLDSRVKEVDRVLQPEISRADAKYNVIEVQAIEKLQLSYKRVNVLAFHNRQTEEMEFNIFEGYEPSADYSLALSRQDRIGHVTIPRNLLVPLSDAVPESEFADIIKPELERLNQILSERQNTEATTVRLRSELSLLKSNDVDSSIGLQAASDSLTTKTSRIMELEAELQKRDIMLSELKAQQSGEVIEGSAHRDLLLSTIKKAKERIIIINPWIKRSATNKEVIRALESAVKRGVWIAIGYGMPLKRDETREDYIDSDVEQELERIKRQPNGERLYWEWLGNTHEKILVCDTKYCVVTSFNWLSYRGDSGLRNETGILSKADSTVAKIIGKSIQRFVNLPVGFPVGLKQLEPEN